MSVWGASDHEDWGSKPLATYAPKFYCGIYFILLNLVMCPEIRLVRLQWKMTRWSNREATPMFGFYVYTDESGTRVCTAVAAAIGRAAAGSDRTD